MQPPAYPFGSSRSAQSSAAPTYFAGVPLYRPTGASADFANRSNNAYLGAQSDLRTEYFKQQGANQPPPFGVNPQKIANEAWRADQRAKAQAG